MNKKIKSDGIVYSTNPNHSYTSSPHALATVKPGEQQLKIFTDKKNRGGKTVTVIAGFSGKEDDMEKLARMLKSKCGVGGSVKDREIIIQGDHRERIISILQTEGYGVKKS